MKITLLGTGTPEPYAARASAGYLVEAAGQRVMLDCGGGSFDRLLQAGVQPGELDALFISHLHSDHMIDYARLVHARWDRGGGQVPELPVYAPAPMREISEKLFGPDGVFALDLTARCEHPASQDVYRERGGVLPRAWPDPAITEIGSGYVHEGKGWTLRAVSVPHVQPYLISFAFRIDCGGRSLVYSGDSGPSNALTRLSEGADLLIHMCFQLSDEDRPAAFTRGAAGHLDIARCAAEAGVKRLVLSHLRDYMDEPELQSRMRGEVAAIYDGDIFVAQDLMAIDLAA